MLKNITLSAEESLLRLARQRAEAEHTTLNAEFRRWLRQYVESSTPKDFTALMSRLEYAQPGKAFSRDEMNER